MKKLILFIAIFLVMISYIVWIMYMSEPKYINNSDKKGAVDLYDIVSIRQYGNIDYNLDLGMVIQIDTTSFKNNHYAVVKLFSTWDEFKDIQINSVTPTYKIIGRGTFYHKVNYFIGFNIMVTTAIFMGIIAIIILFFMIGALREVMGYEPIFDY